MSSRSPEDLQHQAEHTRPSRRMSVLGYLAILFAVAFLLLLLAYFQQQRQNAEATDALKQSASAVESIQLLMEENKTLQAQVEALERETAALKEETASLRKETDAQSQDLERLTKEAQAMQWFWQIDDYYVRGYYRKARELIESFEALELRDSLPTENTTTTDRYTPAERYEEILKALS